MRIVQFDAVSEGIGSTHREGALKRRRLLEGTDGAQDNFALSISRIDGRYSPRHRHNFEQFRYIVEGEANYGRNGIIKAGMIGYFPESAFYGPQEDSGELRQMVLQFGGASGNGYPGRSVSLRVTEELKQLGTFKKGAFYPNEGTGMKQMDGFQAIWEHYNKRPLVYKKPRYPEPIVMDPADFDWMSVEGAPGVYEKLMGVFTEKRASAGFWRLEPNAELKLQGKRDLLVVLSGRGTVQNQPYGQFTSVEADHGDEVTLRASDPTEIIHFRLPDLRGMKLVHKSGETVTKAA